MTRSLPSYTQLARLRAAYADVPWLKPPVVFGLSISVAASRCLRSALGRVVRRHPALSARFPTAETVEYQDPPADTDIDLRQVTVPWSSASVLREIREPFSPAADSLIRFVLATGREPGDDPVLLVSVDHLVFDGHSIEIFCRDLGAVVAGVPDLDEPYGPVLPYEDFVRRQEQFVTSSRGLEAREYWLRQWSDSGLYPPVPGLPAGIGAGGAGRHRHAVVDTSERARAARATPAGYSFAALCRSLSAAAQEGTARPSHVTAITPVANRDSRTRNAIGYFDNRAQVTGVVGRSLQDALRLTSAGWANLLRHGAFPFELVVRELFATAYASMATEPYLFFTSERSPQLLDSADVRWLEFTDPELFADYVSLTVTHTTSHASAFDVIYDTSRVPDDYVSAVLAGLTSCPRALSGTS